MRERQQRRGRLGLDLGWAAARAQENGKRSAASVGFARARREARAAGLRLGLHAREEKRAVDQENEWAGRGKGKRAGELEMGRKS